MALQPLLGHLEMDSALLWRDGRSTSRAEFAARASRLAQRLPGARYAINLCQDRDAFMLGFVACCLRGQTNLLPASQASGALQTIAREYPHHIMNDANIGALLSASADDNYDASERFVCEDAHIAAIAFTSGSTGTPQAHACSWRMLAAAAQRSAAGIFARAELNIVATVPPQHMFGLETTILQPLIGRCAVHVAKPFFPADVATALLSVPAPRALISTPTHLRACLGAGMPLSEIDFVLSATAPLAKELAAHVESAWHTRVLEIYGSTETGAIATRRTTAGDVWTLLPGGQLLYDGERSRYRSISLLPEAILHDKLERVDDQHFILAGRSGDLVKVAGKRASLTELNARLLAVPGVRDGVVVQPEPDGRVAALAVVEGIAEADILSALSAYIDEVFLPRPLRLVSALPRDALGKLPRAQVLAALTKHPSSDRE